IRTNKLDGPCYYCFWPLGVLTHYQHWFAKGRCFFLHSAGISQNDGRTALKLGELVIRQWISNDDVFQILNFWKDRLAHCRIQVKRKSKVDVWVFGCKVLDCTTNFLHRI